LNDTLLLNFQLFNFFFNFNPSCHYLWKSPKTWPCWNWCILKNSTKLAHIYIYRAQNHRKHDHRNWLIRFVSQCFLQVAFVVRWPDCSESNFKYFIRVLCLELFVKNFAYYAKKKKYIYNPKKRKWDFTSCLAIHSFLIVFSLKKKKILSSNYQTTFLGAFDKPFSYIFFILVIYVCILFIIL
jgi:hypothetical protein